MTARANVAPAKGLALRGDHTRVIQKIGKFGNQPGR